MDIEIDERDNATILKLCGYLDATSVVDLEKQLTPVVDNGSNAVVLDFAATEYISSAGLQALLTAAKKLRGQQRAFVLCAINAPVMEVFQITGFHRILRIEESLDQVLNTLA